MTGSTTYHGTPCEWTWEDLESRNVTPPFKPQLVSSCHNNYILGLYIVHNTGILMTKPPYIIIHVCIIHVQYYTVGIYWGIAVHPTVVFCINSHVHVESD